MSDDYEFVSLVVEQATRVFRDYGDAQTINNATDDSWKKLLWSQLQDSGLTLCWVPEEKGGAGAGIAAGFEILKVSGRFAVPVPLAETMLAGWLLAHAGLPAPPEMMTIAPVSDRDAIQMSTDGRVSGAAHAVPFAPEAAHLALLAASDDGPVTALVDMAACTLARGVSIAGHEQARVVLEAVTPVASRPASAKTGAEVLMLMGAAVRARQMAGALQALLDMSVAYAQDRVAFGRPIGKFQAVQHNLARLAGEVAAADAASGSAADALVQGTLSCDAVFLEVASAKIRAGEAAGDGAAIAHQLFGAIGFTQEHILHRFTRSLWAWRDDFGNESWWAEKLGSRVAAAGADELWPMLAAR
jgi:acyl-CoA dehydrogenase